MPHFHDTVYVNGVALAVVGSSGITPQAHPTALVDSSGGTPSGTLAAVGTLSTSNTYTDAAVNAKLAIIANAIASLRTQIESINTKLTTAGVFT